MANSTNHTAIHGPDDHRFGILETNIIFRLLVYYVVVTVVAFFGLKFMPAGWRQTIDSALTPLLGMSTEAVTTFATPDPEVTALSPNAVVLMAIIASLAAIVNCLPVAWTYMFTRQKKGYQQTIVHTLILLPVVVAVVATIVRSSAALAFSLAGIVAAVRFRVALEDSRDAVFVQ